MKTSAKSTVRPARKTHSSPAAVQCRQDDNRQIGLRQLANMMAESPHAVRQRALNDKAAQRSVIKRTIVADTEQAEAGQLNQSTFLEELRLAVSSAASAVLGSTWSASSCPDIQKLFDNYAARGPDDCETVMRRYSGIAAPGSARDYIAPICARIGGAVRRWGEGEELEWGVGASGLPSALESSDPGAAPVIQAKRIDVGTPGITLDQLGPSTSIDHETGSRMAQAFEGEHFDHIQIHTGAPAAQLTHALNADALAVGSHVAFANGEYRPGTRSGDGLIAHELAHVVQQRGNELAQRQLIDVRADSALEQDADQSAAAVMNNLHNGDGQQPVRPALKSGLSVRLGNRPEKEDIPQETPAAKGWEYEAENEHSEEDRIEAVENVYVSIILPLALELIRAHKPTLKNWNDEEIKNNDRMAKGMDMALEDPDIQHDLERLVWYGFYKNIEEVKEAIRHYHYDRHPMSAPFSYKQATAPIPGARLSPDIGKVSEEQFADLERRGNFGDKDGKLALEKVELTNRNEAANELDEMKKDVETLLLTHIGPLGSVGACYTQALVYYKGTREQGHEIWTGFQTELLALMTNALRHGYPIINAEVQKRLVNAALALAQMRSRANGSAGHSEMRR